MAQASFPEPQALNILEIGDNENKSFNKYSVANPHPGYGKDPNILNEYGHTKYPMWVDAPNGSRVLVQNAEEEAELTGIVSKVDAPPASW